MDEFPRFPIRGIVEGFYGQPWSHSQRLDMVRFLGSHRMNTFVYAPKDDVYCRRQWQQPYPATQLQTLGELAGEAASERRRPCLRPITWSVNPLQRRL